MPSSSFTESPTVSPSSHCCDDDATGVGANRGARCAEAGRDQWGVPILDESVTRAPGWDAREERRLHAPGYGDRVWMHTRDDFVKRHTHHIGYDPVAYNYHQVFRERGSRDKRAWSGTRDRMRFMESRGRLTAEQDAAMPHPDRPRIGNWRWLWRRERDLD